MIESVAEETIGIDLSAQPKETAACVIEWSGPARVMYLSVGADNQTIVDLVKAHQPSKVAIDAPFGWPVPFLRAITNIHREREMAEW